MINLCQILHWNSKSVDMSEPNWLQKLVVVCDKYGCAPKLRDFFLVKVVDKRPCAIDHFVITSLIEDRQGFAKISDTVLRTPRRELEATGHEQLLQMLPAGFLGNPHFRPCQVWHADNGRRDAGIPEPSRCTTPCRRAEAHHQHVKDLGNSWHFFQPWTLCWTSKEACTLPEGTCGWWHRF